MMTFVKKVEHHGTRLALVFLVEMGFIDCYKLHRKTIKVFALNRESKVNLEIELTSLRFLGGLIASSGPLATLLAELNFIPLPGSRADLLRPPPLFSVFLA